jgi:hypothetical protein
LKRCTAAAAQAGKITLVLELRQTS